MSGLDAYGRIEVRSLASLRAWLTKHQARTESVWLVTFKKDCGPHVPYGDLVEELLCVGWVDSRPRWCSVPLPSRHLRARDSGVSCTDGMSHAA